MCIVKVKIHLIVGSVADPGCWTQILIHSGSRVRKTPDPDPLKLSIFNPNKCYQALGNMMRSLLRIPDPKFFPSRFLGSKKHQIPDPDPQHWLEGFWNDVVTNAVLRIRDVYPGSDFLSILDLGSRIQEELQERRGKKFCLSCHFL
jgi:hypothetical protein